MRKKGFTLIELLVVIAIIGILATIGLVALNGAREKARDATRKSDLGQIRTALVLYNDDNTNLYPSTDSSTINPNSGSIWGGEDALGDYLSTVPEDPSDTGSYSYEYVVCTTSGTCEPNLYILYTQLESQSTPTYFWINSVGQSGDKATAIPDCTGPDALCQGAAS